MSDLDRIKELSGIKDEQLDEVIREITSNPDSMLDDMKRLMKQGKTVTVVAKESHISDRYKGLIVSYTIKWK